MRSRRISGDKKLTCRGPVGGISLKPLVYKNSTSKLNFSPPVHESEPRGYAYEIDKHFVHFFGRESGLWVISPGLTTTEGKTGSLLDWVKDKFGATNIGTGLREIGETTAGVWRPGILHYDDIRNGLGTTDSERHEALQSVRLILDRLDELFLYVEPCPGSLGTYSHKSRELLILACTEVENAWTRYMRDANATPMGKDYTTNDYVKLLVPLCLNEFEFSLKAFPSVPPTRPFHGWAAAQPTKSLPWYDGYNLTKHDRKTHFDKATLKFCIDAVAANLAMFSVRFSPYPLYHEGGTVSSLFKQLFEVGLRDSRPETFYVPLIKFPDNPNLNLIVFDSASQKMIQPWTVKPLVL
jgi:hypothetical protein